MVVYGRGRFEPFGERRFFFFGGVPPENMPKDCFCSTNERIVLQADV